MKNAFEEARLESDLTEVLRRQAEAMPVPNLTVEDLDRGGVVTPLSIATKKTRRPLLLAVAACLAVAALGVGWLLSGDDLPADTKTADQPSEPVEPTLPAEDAAGEEESDNEPATPAEARYDFSTLNVRLQADDIVIDVPGGIFSPPRDLSGDGDPGTYQEYTSLELIWEEPGTEMRIFIYLWSDGVEWWSDEIWVYDGLPEPDWLYASGDFFRSPLGEPFVGDLDLDHLRIEGLSLEAFMDPPECDGEPGLVLVSAFASIPAGDFGGSATLLDRATCEPVSIDGLTFEFTSSDPAVATVIDGAMPGLLPIGRVRFVVENLGASPTSIHIVGTDTVSGEFVVELDVPVDEGVPFAVPTPDG